jgi:hypothetical protein
MKTFRFIIVLLIGVMAGVAVLAFGGDYIKRYIPVPVRADGKDVEGKVMAKRMDNGKLLVTVQTSEGAVLVTFTHKVSEINLLVAQDDSITLNIRKYEPFISNPLIRRVMKVDSKTQSVERPMKLPEKQVPLPEPEKNTEEDAGEKDKAQAQGSEI